MFTTIIKGAGYVVGAIVICLVLAAGGLYWYTSSTFETEYDVPVDTLTVSTDSATISHGRYIARTRGCRDCHGEDFGGATVVDDPMVGTLSGSNLTPGEGGVGAGYDQDDWIRAIRHGVGPDGRPLMFMPSYEYAELGRRDLAALIAYLDQLPPVDRPRGPVRIGPMARALYVAGDLPQLVAAELVDHARPIPSAPTVDSTTAYGEYVATTCTGCHGSDLSGGPIPGAPPDWPRATNITAHPQDGLVGYDRASFLHAMRTGQRPDGRPIDPVMPFSQFREMTRVELVALWNYLQTLSAPSES